MTQSVTSSIQYCCQACSQYCLLLDYFGIPYFNASLLIFTQCWLHIVITHHMRASLDQIIIFLDWTILCTGFHFNLVTTLIIFTNLYFVHLWHFESSLSFVHLYLFDSVIQLQLCDCVCACHLIIYWFDCHIYIFGFTLYLVWCDICGTFVILILI